jgi:hypothetical protein
MRCVREPDTSSINCWKENFELETNMRCAALLTAHIRMGYHGKMAVDRNHALGQVGAMFTQLYHTMPFSIHRRYFPCRRIH